MTPSTLAICLLLAAQQPTVDLTQESDRALLERVVESKNATAKGVFEELGSRKTRPAFQALKASLQELTANPALKHASFSFRHFKGVPGLEQLAIATLYSVAQESHPSRQRLAAAGLSHFPVAAEAELLRLVSRASDPVTRANALDGLLPALSLRAKPKDLKLSLGAMRVTTSLTRSECVKALRAFMANGDSKNFKGTLTGKTHSLAVKRLILDALSASKAPGLGAHLMDALSSKHSAITHVALLALADRGWTDYGRHLDKLTKHDDEPIRRDALVIRAELYGSDPTFVDRLLDQAEDKDLVKRSAAAISLAALRTTDSLSVLHKMLADPEGSVRFQAMEAAFAARHPSSVPALIARLEFERGPMMPVLADRLNLLTAKDFGSSHARWSAWWRDKGEAFTCPPLEEAEAAKSERKERKSNNTTKASFFGLKILSDRLCFVIDNSSSMKSKTPSGKTRLEAMQDQLCGSLKDLPDGTLVNMVFFAIEAISWKTGLQTLNDKAREDAIESVRDLNMKSATAIYEGIVEGLIDPRVDTLYVLTDGQPSGGAMPKTADILKEIRRINTVRHVVINCISVGRDSTFLAKLAKDNHGEYARVD